MEDLGIEYLLFCGNIKIAILWLDPVDYVMDLKFSLGLSKQTDKIKSLRLIASIAIVNY